MPYSEHDPDNIIKTKMFEVHQFYQDTGEIHEHLTSPEGVIILPVTNEGNIILTKEHRETHGEIYSLPMGSIDNQDNNPLEAAKRELQEEGGYSASEFTHISSHHNGPHEIGLNHFFVARGLSETEATPEEDEQIETLIASFEDAFRLMEEEKIVDLITKACIWAGYIHLSQSEQ